MEGFLPLIEAILAFALTMVALTTAVSVITGVVFRFFRSRAAGLREMMTYFFRNEVIPLLEMIEPPASPDSTVPSKPTGDVFDTSPQGSYETRIDFLVDMTLLPTVIEGEKTAREDMLKEADVRPSKPEPSRTPVCDAVAGLLRGALKEVGESKPDADAAQPSRAHRLESWLPARQLDADIVVEDRDGVVVDFPAEKITSVRPRYPYGERVRVAVANVPTRQRVDEQVNPG